jgi:beta-xylosidase
MNRSRAVYPPATAPAVFTWTDHFLTTTLDSRWSWIREDNTHWSLSDRPGYMRITTQQGGLLGPGNDASNLLVRAAPSGNFEIETRVLFTPTEDFQIAGLLVYDDDDNFLMLGRAYCSDTPPTCEGNAIYFDHEEDGNIVGGNYVMTTTALGEAYLRLARDGNTYTGFVSENGTDWTLVGAHTVISGVVPLKIGLAAEPSGTAAAEIPADFDYFILRIMERLVWLPALFR